MRHHFCRWFALLSLVHWSLAIGPSARAADAPKFELKDGDRVLFIGDTFFEREGDYGHIETRLTAAFPDRNVTFRNLAWAGDTPMGRARASFDWNKPETEWLKRVKEQVALVKPTVAFLSYGMTAALELAETKAEEQPVKLEKFKADLGKLMDAIEEVSGQKVRFVLVGPLEPNSDASGEVQLNGQLLKAVDAIDKAHTQIAGSRQVAVIQLNGMLAKTRYLAAGIFPSNDEYGSIARSIESGGQREIFEGTPAYQLLRSAIRKRTSSSSTAGARRTGPTSSASAKANRARTASRFPGLIRSSPSGTPGSPSCVT